jgi:hypothetical protein
MDFSPRCERLSAPNQRGGVTGFFVSLLGLGVRCAHPFFYPNFAAKIGRISAVRTTNRRNWRFAFFAKD